MLEIYEIEQDPLDNIYAPDVFIDSCEVYNNYINVYYRIEDKNYKWINNELILKDLSLYISCNQEFYKETLVGVKKNSIVKNGIITGYVRFDIKADNITVKAKCENRNLVGNITTEEILSINKLTKSSLDGAEYTYINKNKDLRLLDVYQLSLYNNTEENTYQKSNLYISYTPDKKANIAYIFNIDKFLTENSHTYKILKKYENFKINILNNSSIDVQNTIFYKKKIDKNSIKYAPINSKIVSYEVNKGDPNGDHVITCTDTVNLYDKNEYSVKLNIKVNDYSSQFFKEEVIDKLKTTKNFLLNYKNKYELLQRNNLIENKNEFFYQHKYEQELNNVKEAVENLSTLYSFYTEKPKDEFYSLFLSIFHPLTTNINLLQLLSDSVNNIQNIFNSLLQEINTLGRSTVPFFKENTLVYEIEFKHKSDFINYNYDAYYGYEIMSIDTLENRKSEVFNGMRLLKNSDKTARKTLESGKYYSNTESKFVDRIKFFSFSSLDMGEKSYYLLYNIDSQNVISYNEILVKLNEYNNYKFRYDPLISRYFQLLGKNIYIKSIGAGTNESINGLEKSIIFDPNLDSKQKSLEFITSTGIVPLYLMTDDNKFLCFCDLPTTTDFNIKLPSRLDNKNIFSKPEKIVSYNSFFEDVEILNGTNYSIFELKEVLVNDIFNKNLRIFNKFYILEHENVIQQVQPAQTQYLFESELLFNIPSKYLNRNIEQQKLLLTTDDI